MSVTQNINVGSIDPLRSSPGYIYGSVLFIFDDAYARGVTYLEARDALLGHVFEYLDGRRGKVTTKVDMMRLRSQNDRCYDGSPLKVEAHLEGIDSRSSLQSYLKCIKDYKKECHVSLAFEKRSQPVYAKIVPTIPPRPVYNYYIITDPPLGNLSLIKRDFDSAIENALPDFLHDTLTGSCFAIHNMDRKPLFECFPQYRTDSSYASNPTYRVADFIVIIDTTRGELDSAIQFYLAGQKYELNVQMRYYLFCTKCKIGDSHETDDFDGPFFRTIRF